MVKYNLSDKMLERQQNHHVIAYHEYMIDYHALRRIFEIHHRFNTYPCHVKSAQYRQREIIHYNRNAIKEIKND